MEKETEKQIDALKSLIVSGKTDQLKQVQRMFLQNIANDLVRNRLTEIKVVQHKSSLIRIWKSVSKTFNLLEGRAGNLLEEIKNCSRWSPIVAVILPEIVSFKITLLRISWIGVLKWHVCRLDWIIYGK